VARIVFLGPPGAGKGTQAAVVAKELGIPHLSTGDLLRAAVAAKSPIGLEARQHMDAGRLVPDELVMRILTERIAQPDATTGFVLDGYPRNLAQGEALDRITRLDIVIAFDLPFPVLIERLSGRRVCPTCQTVYNVESRPPRTPGRCDRDGSALVQRPDDLPDPVRTRLEVYAQQTAPLHQYYTDKGLLRTLDARGEPQDVTQRLMALLR
jgi:adenylate kinase